MKMLLFSSEHDKGGYFLNGDKFEKVKANDEKVKKNDEEDKPDESDDEEDEPDYSISWLEYNVRTASKKIGPYHGCYDFNVIRDHNDDHYDDDDDSYGSW